jgi:hypothetical protein
VLDSELERVDDGCCIEGGADLRQRDGHGRSLFCGDLCGGAANALDVALLAALRRIRQVFGKGHWVTRFQQPRCNRIRDISQVFVA